MAAKRETVPFSCSCGSTLFKINAKGKHECLKCESVDIRDFTMTDLPVSQDRSIEDLIQDRLKEEKRTFDADKINKNLCVSFPHAEPIAIVAFGDPHLDDAGTSLSKVLEDLNSVKTNENVYGMCIGDITNNWVGRLGALYGEQNTTVAESWMLVEHFCNEIPWIAMVLGNHDKWNHGVEILKQITKGKLVQADECSFVLSFKGGLSFTINARHKWSGNSMWNPAHGVAKYAHFGGDYDVVIGGHTHQSAYTQVLATRSHRISHCIQLASYKMIDSYARSEGFRHHNIAPSMCLVFDPNATREEDKIVVTYSIEKGLALHKTLLQSYRKSLPAKELVKAPTKAVKKTPAKTRKR